MQKNKTRRFHDSLQNKDVLKNKKKRPLSITMKFHLIIAHDSHLKAVKPIEVYLRSKNRTVIRHNIINNTELDKAPSLPSIMDGDIIISAIGGGKMNELVKMLGGRKVLLVGLFPGIISQSKIEDLIGKWYFDILLVNCHRDLTLYNTFCEIHNLNSNAILYGCSWFDDGNYSSKILTDLPNKYFLFIEQLGIPDNKAEANALLADLDALSGRMDTKCVVKLRQSSLFGSPEQGKSSLLHYQITSNLKNITFSTEPMSTLIEKSKFVVSFSSSALIESILLGKPTFVITDFGSKRYFVDYFVGSGIQTFIKDISATNTVNNNWRENFCIDPNRHLPEVIDRIEQSSPAHRNANFSVWKFLQLILRYRLILGNFGFLHNLLKTYFRISKRGASKGV